MANELDLELSEDLKSRLLKSNTEYLTLLRDVSRRDPCAAATLGLTGDVIDVFASCELRKLLDIASKPIAMCKLRFSDAKFWREALVGDIDSNDIVHRLLKEA